MLWLFLTVCLGLASEVKDAWNEDNMQEEPPAVCHPAVRGHFSWALPQGTWLIGLDWRDTAHECSSHFYSSFIMHHSVQRCWSRTCLSLLWTLFKTNCLNTKSQNISSRCSDWASQMWFSLCYSPWCRQKAFSGWDPATHVIIYRKTAPLLQLWYFTRGMETLGKVFSLM